MRLQINHLTSYQYDAPLTYGLQQLRLTPKGTAGQSIVSWDIEIDGGRIETSFTDQHNNHVDLVSFDRDRSDVSIRCAGVVDTVDTAGIVGQHGGYAPLWLFQRSTPLTHIGSSVRKLARELGTDFNGDIPRLHALSDMILDKVAYAKDLTDTDTTSEEALNKGVGVCQDHAHIFIAVCREMGLPARYVSGFLLLEDQIDQDAGHAWAEAHVEGLGWVGFDVSNAMCPDERYVRVATGLDAREAAPISGMTFGTTEEKLVVTLQVQQ